jgi:23S rRNA U2552 (ribose-2'-O)-methylase RlmE/FtsJ
MEHPINFTINFKVDCDGDGDGESDFKLELGTQQNIYIDASMETELNMAKSQINQYTINNLWNKYKKLTNLYENVYLSSKKFEQFKNVAIYNPVSRSYFKMIEIANEFLTDIIKTPNPIKILHLAEGPGGFLESIIRMRKNTNDHIYAMTLLSKDKLVPNWAKVAHYQRHYKNLKFITGIDGTGDLYNPENIRMLCDTISSSDGANKAILITGDGGFDFSDDYNAQESVASKLIFAQIVAAISNQAIGGSFVCKFFNLNSIITIQMIYLMKKYYSTIHVFKPFTSRPANSEIYLVFKEFRGIDIGNAGSIITVLLNMLTNWNDKTTSIFNDSFSIPQGFIDEIHAIHHKICTEQIEYINKTIRLIEFPYHDDEYKKNIDLQNEAATKWCDFYGVEHRQFTARSL